MTGFYTVPEKSIAAWRDMQYGQRLDVLNAAGIPIESREYFAAMDLQKVFTHMSTSAFIRLTEHIGAVKYEVPK